MRGSQVELARWCRLVGTTVWPGCDPAVRLAIPLPPMSRPSSRNRRLLHAEQGWLTRSIRLRGRSYTPRTSPPHSGSAEAARPSET